MVALVVAARFYSIRLRYVEYISVQTIHCSIIWTWSFLAIQRRKMETNKNCKQTNKTKLRRIQNSILILIFSYIWSLNCQYKETLFDQNVYYSIIFPFGKERCFLPLVLVFFFGVVSHRSSVKIQLPATADNWVFKGFSPKIFSTEPCELHMLQYLWFLLYSDHLIFIGFY